MQEHFKKRSLENIMTEEKKSQIRKIISVIEIVLAGIMVGYLVYGVAAKNLNTMLNNIIAITVVSACVILNDFVEPYLTEVFVNMDDFRKEAYKKYVFWDIASMAGLLFFVLTFVEDGSMMVYLGLVLYFIGTKQKRPYQSAYLGNVTKEDIEAAKEAAENIEE